MRVLLPALRALKLTENLEMLIPDVSFSPIQLLQKQGAKTTCQKAYEISANYCKYKALGTECCCNSLGQNPGDWST